MEWYGKERKKNFHHRFYNTNGARICRSIVREVDNVADRMHLEFTRWRSKSTGPPGSGIQPAIYYADNFLTNDECESLVTNTRDNLRIKFYDWTVHETVRDKVFKVIRATMDPDREAQLKDVIRDYEVDLTRRLKERITNVKNSEFVRARGNKDSAKWHTDGGPTDTVRILIYLTEKDDVPTEFVEGDCFQQTSIPGHHVEPRLLSESEEADVNRRIEENEICVHRVQSKKGRIVMFWGSLCHRAAKADPDSYMIQLVLPISYRNYNNEALLAADEYEDYESGSQDVAFQTPQAKPVFDCADVWTTCRQLHDQTGQDCDWSTLAEKVFGIKYDESGDSPVVRDIRRLLSKSVLTAYDKSELLRLQQAVKHRSQAVAKSTFYERCRSEIVFQYSHVNDTLWIIHHQDDVSDLEPLLRHLNEHLLLRLMHFQVQGIGSPKFKEVLLAMYNKSKPEWENEDYGFFLVWTTLYEAMQKELQKEEYLHGLVRVHTKGKGLEALTESIRMFRVLSSGFYPGFMMFTGFKTPRYVSSELSTLSDKGRLDEFDEQARRTYLGNIFARLTVQTTQTSDLSSFRLTFADNSYHYLFGKRSMAPSVKDDPDLSIDLDGDPSMLLAAVGCVMEPKDSKDSENPEGLGSDYDDVESDLSSDDADSEEDSGASDSDALGFKVSAAEAKAAKAKAKAAKAKAKAAEAKAKAEAKIPNSKRPREDSSDEEFIGRE